MRKLGWVRPFVRFPAVYWTPQIPYVKTCPSKFSLDCERLPATDQGDEPESPSHAVCSALDIIRNRSVTEDTFHPSYSYIRRSMYNSPESYGGNRDVSITDVIRHIQKYGYTSESICPYSTGQELTPIDDEVAKAGLNNTGSQFLQISLAISTFKLALMELFPIVCGIVAYDRINDVNDGRDGIIRAPESFSWPTTGYALCITGWDDDKQSFRFRSSFGALWGTNGYGWIPYTYVTQYATSDDHYVCISP